MDLKILNKFVSERVISHSQTIGMGMYFQVIKKGCVFFRGGERTFLLKKMSGWGSRHPTPPHPQKTRMVLDKFQYSSVILKQVREVAAACFIF